MDRECIEPQIMINVCFLLGFGYILDPSRPHIIFSSLSTNYPGKTIKMVQLLIRNYCPRTSLHGHRELQNFRGGELIAVDNTLGVVILGATSSGKLQRWSYILWNSSCRVYSQTSHCWALDIKSNLEVSPVKMWYDTIQFSQQFNAIIEWKQTVRSVKPCFQYLR